MRVVSGRSDHLVSINQAFWVRMLIVGFGTHADGRGGSPSVVTLTWRSEPRFSALVWVYPWRFTKLFLRYPYNVPQGTAIPRWALYNVAVRRILAYQSSYTTSLDSSSTLRVSRTKPSTFPSLNPLVVSLIVHQHSFY